MRLNKYFILQEFMPEEIYNSYADASIMFIDPRCIQAAYDLRVIFGKCYINTWVWGGSRNNSGFRAPLSMVGARLSQHRFGRALDIVFEDVKAEQVREHIKASPSRFQALTKITRIENDTSHLHIDFANIGDVDDIVFFDK